MRRLLIVCLSALLVTPVTGVADAAASTTGCTVSKAAFPRLKLDGGRWTAPPPPDQAFAALTTNRNGLWAGFAFQEFPQRFAVITWRPGQAKAKVLGRFGAHWQRYAPGISVSVAGIGPSGAVVASAQVDRHERRFMGYAWSHGRRYTLAHRKSWVSVSPAKVTDTGAILGIVRTRVDGHLRRYLVGWPSWRRPARPLMRIPAGWTVASIDDVGDVAFNRADGRASVRLANGATHRLGEPIGEQVVISNAAGRSVYGYSADGVYRYDLTSVPAGQVIAPGRSLGRGMGANNAITAVSRRGDLVTGIRAQRLRTASGAWYRLPKSDADSPTPAQGFDAAGVFAFTSARDGRVHFVHCR